MLSRVLVFGQRDSGVLGAFKLGKSGWAEGKVLDGEN